MAILWHLYFTFVIFLFALSRKKEKRRKKEIFKSEEKEKSAKQYGKQLGNGQVCARCMHDRVHEHMDMYMNEYVAYNAVQQGDQSRAPARTIKELHEKKTSYKRERYAGEHSG